MDTRTARAARAAIRNVAEPRRISAGEGGRTEAATAPVSGVGAVDSPLIWGIGKWGTGKWGNTSSDAPPVRFRPLVWGHGHWGRPDSYWDSLFWGVGAWTEHSWGQG